MDLTDEDFKAIDGPCKHLRNKKMFEVKQVVGYKTDTVTSLTRIAACWL